MRNGEIDRVLIEWRVLYESPQGLKRDDNRVGPTTPLYVLMEVMDKISPVTGILKSAPSNNPKCPLEFFQMGFPVATQIFP